MYDSPFVKTISICESCAPVELSFTRLTHVSRSHDGVDHDARRFCSSSMSNDTPPPISCIYQPSLKLFLVTRSSQTLLSGGYGVVIDSKDYLFLEEVLVLHEMGLLEAFGDHEQRLDTQQLFGMMSLVGLSLRIYIVYAYLRQQTYRVVRHTPTRRHLLEQLQEQPTNLHLRHALRHDAAQAPAPSLLEEQDSFQQQQQPLLPAFDVYRPSANFARSNPGRPDFSVAVTSFHSNVITFSHILQLQLAVQHLKVATVSDGGTVIMFGVTDFGVPDRRMPGSDPEGEDEE